MEQAGLKGSRSIIGTLFTPAGAEDIVPVLTSKS
jgi:hypothetical protein